MWRTASGPRPYVWHLCCTVTPQVLVLRKDTETQPMITRHDKLEVEYCWLSMWLLFPGYVSDHVLRYDHIWHLEEAYNTSQKCIGTQDMCMRMITTQGMGGKFLSWDFDPPRRCLWVIAIAKEVICVNMMMIPLQCVREHYWQGGKVSECDASGEDNHGLHCDMLMTC